MRDRWVTVMGSYVADVSFRTPRMPARGETVMGEEFRLGPGGKGSNQAVAAARAATETRVSFISKVGRDAFGEMARKMYAAEGVDTRYLLESDEATGAAAILIDAASGENSIIVVPGACYGLTAAEVEGMREWIAGSAIFLTQLELDLKTVEFGLWLARELKVVTVLNPAPGRELSDAILQCCDYVVPNEIETEVLTGVKVVTLQDAERAADVLLGRGVGNVVITLGAQGVFVKNAAARAHIAAFNAGPVVETTGAGDAFCGGFATALAEGRELMEAARFGCAVAGISVTRAGAAQSMPRRSEVDALMKE
jgi:ribokinase